MDVAPTRAALNPLRPPDWRFRRAEVLLAAGRFPSRYSEGPEIHAIATFLRAKRSIAGAGFAKQVASSPDGLDFAIEVQSGRHPRLAAAVEAMLLANVSDEEIGQLGGLPASCIHWYHAAFFDVRDRLLAPIFIDELIDRAEQANPGDWRWAGWKRIAVRQGRDVLLHVLANDRTADSPYPPVVRTMLHDKLQVAAGAIPNTDVKAIAKAFQVLDAQAPQPEFVPLNFYERNVDAVLREIEYTVGKRRYPDHPALREWENCAVELRPHQVAQLMRGEPLENAEELKAKKFPPPRNSGHEGIPAWE